MNSPHASQSSEYPRRVVAEALLEQSPAHGIALLDAAGHVRTWSHGASLITGYEPDGILGRPISMLFTEADRAQGLDEQELRVARETGNAEDERWHLRRDGSRFWSSGNTTPVRTPDGDIDGYIKVFKDATHLRNRLAYLENLRRECEAIQSARDLFVGGIAHELRNPLAPLKMALEILRTQLRGNDATRHPLQIMDRQVGFMERLVEDLVDLTRASTGRLSIDAERTVLQPLLAEAVHACASVSSQKGVDVRLVAPSVPLEAEVDAERMLQVLVNLINNGVKFTPSGGIVWVTLTADQTHFLVYVRDTGIGIGPDLLPVVFDAFAQADGAGSSRGAGIGIGLAVVKEIVTLHGGTVEAQSRGRDKGSEFIIRIPLDRRAPEPAAAGTQ